MRTGSSKLETAAKYLLSTALTITSCATNQNTNFPQISNNSYARTLENGEGTTIIYINGMACTTHYYVESLNLVRELAKETIPAAKVKGFRNHSATEIDIEIFGSENPFQQLIEVSTKFIEGLVDYTQANDQYFHQLNPLGNKSPLGKEQARELRDSILEELAYGNNVIILAHSQGALFAQQALDQIDQLENIQTIQTGGPAVRMPGTSVRVDYCLDPISRMGSPIMFNCLRPPFFNLNPISHHMFNTAYMKKEGEARAVIGAHLIEMSRSLHNNPSPNN